MLSLRTIRSGTPRTPLVMWTTLATGESGYWEMSKPSNVTPESPDTRMTAPELRSAAR